MTGGRFRLETRRDLLIFGLPEVSGHLLETSCQEEERGDLFLLESVGWTASGFARFLLIIVTLVMMPAHVQSFSSLLSLSEGPE